MATDHGRADKESVKGRRGGDWQPGGVEGRVDDCGRRLAAILGGTESNATGTGVVGDGRGRTGRKNGRRKAGRARTKSEQQGW